MTSADKKKGQIKFKLSLVESDPFVKLPKEISVTASEKELKAVLGEDKPASKAAPKSNSKKEEKSDLKSSSKKEEKSDLKSSSKKEEKSDDKESK